MAVCKKGLEKHPNYTSGRIVLGRVYQDQSKSDEAAGEFKKVLEADPENLLALSLLGELHFQKKDFQGAIEEYQKILALNPDDEVTQAALKEAIEKAADHQKSAKPPSQSATKPEKTQPKDSTATLTIAELYLKQGHFDKAIEVFQELLAEDPQNLMLRQKLSEAVEQQQKNQSSSGGVAAKIKKDEFTRPPDPGGDTIAEDVKADSKKSPRDKKTNDAKFTSEDILQVMLRGGKDDVVVEDRSKAVRPAPSKETPVQKPEPAVEKPKEQPQVPAQSVKSPPDQMEGLKGVLAELAGVEGILGSYLLAPDGTAVVSVGETGGDKTTLSKLSGAIFKSTQHSVVQLQQGTLQQVLITAEKGQILLVSTGPGILVVLADEKIKMGLLRLALDSALKKIDKSLKS